MTRNKGKWFARSATVKKRLLAPWRIVTKERMHKVQLSLLKPLLLIDEVVAMVQGVDGSEREFMEMHDAFRRNCGPTYKNPPQ